MILDVEESQVVELLLVCTVSRSHGLLLRLRGGHPLLQLQGTLLLRQLLVVTVHVLHDAGGA